MVIVWMDDHERGALPIEHHDLLMLCHRITGSARDSYFV